MELVGQCRYCGKNVYCRDGFLDGIVDETKQVVCHSCADQTTEHKEDHQSSKPDKQ